MASVNKAIILGNLGADPEVRYMPDGAAVANLRIATTEVWKDKSGEKQEATEWHRVTLYKRLAEIAGEYLKKGSQVYIEGRIQTRKWQDKQGEDRYTTEIVGSELKMLGSRGEGGERRAPQERGSAPDGGGSTRRPPQQQTGTPFDDMEDDIPFASCAVEHDPMGKRLARRLARAK